MKRALHFVASCAVAAALAGAFTACGAKGYDAIEDAVREGAVLGEAIVIDGIDVSGMGVAQARRLIRAQQQSRVSEYALTVSAAGRTHTVTGEELRPSFDTDAVLLQALALPGRTVFRPIDEERILTTAASVSESAARRCAAEAAIALDREPQDAQVVFDPHEYIDFSYEEESPGVRTDVETLARALAEQAAALRSGNLEAVHERIPAEYTVGDAMADTELIAEFSTSFKGSTYSKENRVFNIMKAASMIDGACVEPMEEFSINAVLGARNGENGWREATGIREGAYVQEYGGGVCQVSTTLYNAVLMADLEITERSHHSWPLGYIDVGRDATISTGGPDLRFVNTSGARLFIRSSVDTKNKRVTVLLYGRAHANGVTIRVTSKRTGYLDEPETEILTDASLKPGEEKIVREARRGCTAETYKEYYAPDGERIGTELVTRDKYRSIKGLKYIGPAPENTPAPESTPEAVPTPEATDAPEGVSYD